MIALLSDIHANLSALDAVVNAALVLGVNKFISLGDVVGYGPSPGECIDLLESLQAESLLGNHDVYMISGMASSPSKVVSDVIDYQRGKLHDRHMNWLAKSKVRLTERDRYFVHGGPDRPCEQYLYEISAATIPEGFKWLFSGHTHVQFLANFNGKSFCNPGSVGQPRDGDWRAAFATFDGYKVRLFRVPYDVDATVAAMRVAGFPSNYYSNLYSGTQIGGRIDSIRIVEK
jgi:putative phosphoesterase